MTTHLECECEREPQLDMLDAPDTPDGLSLTREMLRLRHQAYEALVAEELREEDEEERAERREMVELAQEFMRQSLRVGEPL